MTFFRRIAPTNLQKDNKQEEHTEVYEVVQISQKDLGEQENRSTVAEIDLDQLEDQEGLKEKEENISGKLEIYLKS